MSLAALATLALVAVLAPAVHVSATAVVHHLLGLTPDRVSFGLGPALVERRVGGVALRLAAIPLGAYVALPLDDAGEPRRLPPARLIVASLAGPVVVILLAVALGASAESIPRALGQIFLGALSPLETGAGLARAWLATADAAPLRGAGLLALRIALFNLLPLPSLGGFAVLEALALLALRRERFAHPAALTLAGSLLTLGLSLGWLVAVITAMTS